MRTVSPTPHFVAFSQAGGPVSRRRHLAGVEGPGCDVAIGVIYFTVASVRFRKALFG
jgi:hypothetical protein